MASEDPLSSNSESNVMWEHGDDSQDTEISVSDSDNIPEASMESPPPTPGLSIPTSSLGLSSREPPTSPFPTPGAVFTKKLSTKFELKY